MSDGKREQLGRIVTKQHARPQRPEELFPQLASRVFDQTAADRLAGMSGESNDEEKKRLIDAYVDKPVDSRHISAYEQGRAVGSEFILDMKKTHKEDAARLTYEHLLADRICRPTHNIVLYGPTGSGKSYKLLYVYHKYIWNLTHCVERNVASKCETLRRVRIRITLDDSDCSSPDKFYDKVYLAVVSGLDAQLSRIRPGYLDDHFIEFIRSLFAPGRELPPFVQSLWADGLTASAVGAANIPTLAALRKACLEQDHRRELAMLVLLFCGWLRGGKCENNKHCLYVEFDNVDASPMEVQDALVSLLEDTDPREFALLVCACRTETLSRWHSRRRILDLIQHVGPTAYDVVMRDIERFLKDHAQLPDQDPRLAALRSDLHNREPREFIDNLALMHGKLKTDYLRRLFEKLFASQIRGGLLFAGAIVKVAAGHSRDALVRFMDEQSVYAVGRMLYRPHGLDSPAPKVVNVFAQSPEVRDRLLGVRLLELIRSRGPYQLTVQDVCHAMQVVAADNVVIACLQKLMEGELLRADVKERLQLEPGEKSARVRLRLTETGAGILDACATYNYISALMYYTFCDGVRYGYPRYSDEECAGDATVESVFSTLRIFLRETADIEKEDIVRAQRYCGRHPDLVDLRDERGYLRLGLCVPDLYEESIATAARIATAINTRNAVDSALNFRAEYEAWREDIGAISDVFLRETGQEYCNMCVKLSEANEQLRAKPGGAGDPMPRNLRHHGHPGWPGSPR